MKISFILLATATLILLPACSAVPQPPSDDKLPDENIHVEVIDAATAISGTIPTPVPDDKAAHSTLVIFFDHLHNGRYEEAVTLYGGSYQIMVEHNPLVNSQDHVTLLRNACTINGAQCLQIKIAGIERKPSDSELVFGVQFQLEDGSTFLIPPPPGSMQPPITFFEIRVSKNADGSYQVLDMPPYLP